MRKLKTAAVAAALVLIGVQFVTPWPYLTPDAVSYLSMARSLADDLAFRRLGQPQVVYGPVYPLVLAPLFALSAEPYLLVGVFNAALLAAFGRLAYLWARAVAPDAAAHAAWLTVVNVVVLGLFRRPLSETVFCGGLFALAVGYNRVLAGRKPGVGWLAVIPLQCGVALLRQSALMVAGGFALAALWQATRGRRTWASALVLASAATVPPAVTVAAWSAYDATRGSGSSQFSNTGVLVPGSRESQFAEMPTEPLARRLAEGLRVRTAEVGQVTIPGMSKAYAPAETWRNVNTAVYSVWFVVFLVGWWRHVRAADDALAWAWPLYFALHVYWPFNQSARYTAPLLPLLVVCLWRAFARFPRTRGRAVAAVTVLHLGVSVGFWAVEDAPRAYAVWRHRDHLRRIADEFRDRPHELAVAANAEDLRLALEFFLDRPVQTTGAGGGRATREVGWGDAKRSPGYRREVVVRTVPPVGPP